MNEIMNWIAWESSKRKEKKRENYHFFFKFELK